MSIEENKAIVKRYSEEPWSTGNLAALDELTADTFVLHPDMTLDGMKEAIRTWWRRAVPDLTNTVEEMIAEGEKVVFRWTMHGTHTGVYIGLPPTGKPVTFTGITIVRLVDGKIADDRFESGSPSLEQQVGVVPMPTP